MRTCFTAPYETLSNGNQTYTVSGLLDGKEVDPFADDYVSVSFAGFSSQGEATLETLSEEEPVSLFSYSLYPKENLKNGDTVTLEVTASDSKLEEAGYFMPGVLEKTFTVSGLAEYYDISGSFPETELSKLVDQALKASIECEKDDEELGFTVLSPSVVRKSYFLKVFDDSEPHEDYWFGVDLNNAVVVVTSYTLEVVVNERQEWTAWVFPNYYENADGTLVYDVEEAHDYSLTPDNIEEFEEWLYDEYEDMTIIELDLPD